jgi:hypothetical protein
VLAVATDETLYYCERLASTSEVMILAAFGTTSDAYLTDWWDTISTIGVTTISSLPSTGLTVTTVAIRMVIPSSLAVDTISAPPGALISGLNRGQSIIVLIVLVLALLAVVAVLFRFCLRFTKCWDRESHRKQPSQRRQQRHRQQDQGPIHREVPVTEPVRVQR